MTEFLEAEKTWELEVAGWLDGFLGKFGGERPECPAAQPTVICDWSSALGGRRKPPVLQTKQPLSRFFFPLFLPFNLPKGTSLTTKITLFPRLFALVESESLRSSRHQRFFSHPSQPFQRFAIFLLFHHPR